MSKKILIAEDEPDIVLSMRARLEYEGYEVAACGDGIDCLSMMDQLKPDLLLLDILMPKVSGFEVCRIIKANPETRQIPVIFVTGITGTSLLQKAKECGADDVIQKPYDVADLLAKLKKYLGG